MLIVEDDALVGRVLSDAVEDYGGRVIGVADIPTNAFGLVVEHRPDVVVMDIRLEERSGRAARRRCDEDALQDAHRVLHRATATTGHDLRGSGDFGRAECLAKPVRPAGLARRRFSEGVRSPGGAASAGSDRGATWHASWQAPAAYEARPTGRQNSTVCRAAGNPL